MKKPDIVEVKYLFPDLYSELIWLLKSLTVNEWNYPTSNSKWSVKDITAHLLDIDLRRISFQRDKLILPSTNKQNDEIVEYLNYLNDSWIKISRRLSPGLLIDMLNYSSCEIPKLFNSLDLNGEAMVSVNWAGEEKSKNWFDIAREYTERWYHQQQIREAVSKPLLSDDKWMMPLIDTFVRGLPNTYQKIIPDSPETVVLINIEGISQGKWILKNNKFWELYTGELSEYSSKVVLTADTAWRMFSKNISKEEAKNRIRIEGDKKLGLIILELTTFIK